MSSSVEAIAKEVVERYIHEISEKAQLYDYVGMRFLIEKALIQYTTEQVQATWEAAIREVERVTLVHAENESMEVGFVCARNSCLANLRRRALEG